MNSGVYRVMTVCTGNICRSPMAEIVLRDRLEAAGLADRVVVDSSGVSDEEYGNPVDPRARQVLAEHGYPTGEGHQARQVTAADVGSRDLVLAMTAHHAQVLRRLSKDGDGARVHMYRSFDPAAPTARPGQSEHVLDVDDPWFGDQAGFETCLAEIEAAADGVVEHVRAELSGPADEIRRVAADEWLRLKALRLESLQDPAAPVAFLESYEEAAAKPDEFWQDRAARAASGAAVAQYVAVAADGTWAGTATGLVEEPGTNDFEGVPVHVRQVHVVGVYVRPEHRGRGLVERMLDAVVAWAQEQGIRRARMYVHADNARARAAYRKAGFTPSGRRFTGTIGEELELARDV